MNNKKISFIIINEKTKKNINFSVSYLFIKIGVVVTIAGFIIASYLLIQYYSQHSYREQLTNLNIKEQKVKSMLDLFIKQDMVSDSLLLQFDLLQDYHNLNNFLPISKPVDGIITRGIIKDKKNPHNGLDIAAIFKSDVMATQKGFVVLSDNIDYLGNTVIIVHPNNYYSLYAHMNKRLVSNREFVEKNQIIGHVGKSENDKGPHLHFEIWHNNLIIDTRNLIEEYKEKDVSIR
ncbi:MAG: M23 family metallopeptidase [Candidatus Thalassarchaeum sp.]|nr:M23 family metallopeptidase [Candidatus Thalassarchaeum sp.]